jgi:hypothetical protein
MGQLGKTPKKIGKYSEDASLMEFYDIERT